MIKTRSTNIAQQEALNRDETSKGSAPQANKSLQEQITQLKELVSEIKK